MVLSEKQKNELYVIFLALLTGHISILFSNQAIADYLATNGYTGSLKEFCGEANIVSSDGIELGSIVGLGLF